MKTQIMISIKIMAMAMLLGTILALTGCKGKTNTAVPGNEITADSIKKAKVPEMDIHTATYMGNQNIVKQHIAAGSDLNIKNEYGSTPLMVAATFGKTEVALLLIEGGADVNMTNNENSSPLHTAAFFCRTEIVKALLEHGADKSLKNIYGSTALESVMGPFAEVKPVYDQISKDLGPFGLKLDYDYLEKTRPVIAKLLQ
jgi:hypothetical protein